MMHPLAGVFLVTEESYRRERAVSNFRPFRRHRGEAADVAPAVPAALPRQRTESGSTTHRQGTSHHQHAA